MALRYTHVSIPTRDADRAALWYQKLFGLEELAAPNFGSPVRWFRVGDLQLHLYQRNEERAPMQHFGLAVDDFEAVYARAQEIGAVELGAGPPALHHAGRRGAALSARPRRQQHRD